MLDISAPQFMLLLCCSASIQCQCKKYCNWWMDHHSSAVNTCLLAVPNLNHAVVAICTVYVKLVMDVMELFK